MSKILIRREHALTLPQARRAADAIARDLAEEFGVRSQWDGNTLCFERTGLEGELELLEGEMTLEIRLGLLMSAFREPITRGIESRLAKVLAEAGENAANKRRRPATPKARRDR